jgi:hypothetical protein
MTGTPRRGEMKKPLLVVPLLAALIAGCCCLSGEGSCPIFGSSAKPDRTEATREGACPPCGFQASSAPEPGLGAPAPPLLL